MATPAKPGRTPRPEGCLAFFTHMTVGGRSLTAVGVVLGQGHGSNTSALLAAAGEADTQLVTARAGTGVNSTTTRRRTHE